MYMYMRERSSIEDFYNDDAKSFYELEATSYEAAKNELLREFNGFDRNEQNRLIFTMFEVGKELYDDWTDNLYCVTHTMEQEAEMMRNIKRCSIENAVFGCYRTRSGEFCEHEITVRG